MIDLFARNSYDPPRSELRRIVVTMLLLLAVSVAWHGVRSPMTRQLAQSSVGCGGREPLILGALRRLDPTIPDVASIVHHSLPRPGWLTWSVQDVQQGRDARAARWRTTFADSSFRIRGMVAGYPFLHWPPVDMDGDGTWEVLVESGKTAPVDWYWAVLRLREHFNEVVWVGALDEEKWSAAGGRVRPVWRDAGRGTHELAFITVVATRTPAGGIAFKPPETVAVFRPAGEHGMLRPELLPQDCGITSWTAPSVAPRVDPLADLETLFPQMMRAAQQRD